MQKSEFHFVYSCLKLIFMSNSLGAQSSKDLLYVLEILICVNQMQDSEFHLFYSFLSSDVSFNFKRFGVQSYK